MRDSTLWIVYFHLTAGSKKVMKFTLSTQVKSLRQINDYVKFMNSHYNVAIDTFWC